MDLELGERITIRVLQENREWGYNPAPDGTAGEVVGFSHISWGRANGVCKPGVYLNRCWPKVKLETGDTITIYHGHLAPVEIREREFLPLDKRKERDFVSELPETLFWEGDRVRLLNPPSYLKCDEVYVSQIHYDRIRNPSPNAHPNYIKNVYDLQERIDGGRIGNFGEDDLELIERGWVWNHYHDEPIEFPTLKDEANFYKSLAQVTQVKNPKTGHYGWDSLQDVLDGIEQGLGHAFTGSRGGLFGGSGINHSLWRYHDEELGKRLAEATLEEFKAHR